MPLLWRTLIIHFLRIVLFCVFAFVAILLTMRLDEIAHFAAWGAPLHCIFLFTLHQIPYILPIALPLSCLIASLIIIQQMSNNQELTALRACGFSFQNIFAPIWLTAAFLSLGNFWIVSEYSTFSHFQNNRLKSELKSVNPLRILHHKHLMRLKGFYFETLGNSEIGESAYDAILALPNPKDRRLNLMIAKKMKANSEIFYAEGISLITGWARGKEQEDFDELLIKNTQTASTRIEDLFHSIKKNRWTIHNDYLQMPLLIARIQEQKFLLSQATKEEKKFLRIQLNKSLSEIVKRVSIALAVFSFTLMGTSFGISINRKKNHLPLAFVIGLTAIYLAAFFTAKTNDRYLILASVLYLFPHLLIVFFSLFILHRTTKGV